MAILGLLGCSVDSVEEEEGLEDCAVSVGECRGKLFMNSHTTFTLNEWQKPMQKQLQLPLSHSSSAVPDLLETNSTLHVVREYRFNSSKEV